MEEEFKERLEDEKTESGSARQPGEEDHQPGGGDIRTEEAKVSQVEGVGPGRDQGGQESHEAESGALEERLEEGRRSRAGNKPAWRRS